jgi:hypothetical protein
MNEIISTFLLLFCFSASSAASNDEKIDLSQLGVRIYGYPIKNKASGRAARMGNPEENGPYLEGDLLTPIAERNGIQFESARWPNREIPYVIKQGFSEFPR